MVESAGPRQQQDGTVPTTITSTTTTTRVSRFEILRMSEQKCVLSQSCCGCSLRSGSLAIGILGVIGGILGTISGIYLGINGNNQGWVDMVINIITLILAAILIQGVRAEKRGLVMVWVWVMGIIVIINIILGIIAIILTFNIIGGVILFIIMGIAVYCILVVRSYAISLGGGTGGMA